MWTVGCKQKQQFGEMDFGILTLLLVFLPPDLPSISSINHFSPNLFNAKQKDDEYPKE